MKLMLLAALSVLGISGAMAQVDGTFCFLDANGDVVADGSTVTFNTVEEEIFPGMPMFGTTLMAKFDLKVKNTTETNAKVGAKITIVSMPNGKVQFCFPSECAEFTNEHTTSFADLTAGATQALNSEWLPEAGEHGTAKFKLQLLVGDGAGGIKAYGPTVNIVCQYYPTGINDITSDNAGSVYYDLSGRRISSPSKGIVIVNGKKVIQ